MKLLKQAVSLQVHDISVLENKKLIKHSILLPNSIRGMICGPSNCGKTNVMLTLLLHENGLRFKNIYLYSKTFYQPKYCYLKKIIERVPNAQLFEFRRNDEVIPPNEVLPNSVIIFDDIITENQSNIRDYFTMGRHNHIDCFYLSQTYSKVPKQLLRDNINFLLIFKQDDTNLKHIYEEHANSDLTWRQFKDLCSIVWEKSHNFVTICKDSPLNNGRYRQNLDVFIDISR